MALPGHRRTSSQGKKRAKHYRLLKRAVSTCRQCAALILPHHACKACGYYAGRPTLTVKTKKKKTA